MFLNTSSAVTYLRVFIRREENGTVLFLVLHLKPPTLLVSFIYKIIIWSKDSVKEIETLPLVWRGSELRFKKTSFSELFSQNKLLKLRQM